VVLDAAGIVTLAGTDNADWLLDNWTGIADPAGLSKERVQTVDPLLPSFGAAHESPVNCALGAFTVRVNDCELLPIEAVSTADWLLTTEATVTVRDPTD
jgi:hypothetical protein